MAGKTHAIIIDHVNNVIRHGLPDAPRYWSLDRRERRRTQAEDVIPLKTCLNDKCLAVYERVRKNCPNCGFYSPPAQRSTPEQVDGDLLELDPEVLARLRGEVDRIDSAPRIPQHLDHIAQRGVANRHKERQQAQAKLREMIALWAGHMRAQGHDDSSIYRHFYISLNIDIMTAQALGAREAERLEEKLRNAIDAMGNSTVSL